MFGISAALLISAATTFNVARPSELVARLDVRCDSCSWEVLGREAVLLKLRVDDGPTIHLPVLRAGRAEYRVMLGAAGPGIHTLHVDEDASLTATALRGNNAAVVENVTIEQSDAASPDTLAASLAPFVYARPNTVGRFTDVPLFMWYEIEPTPRGRRFRYSVIFSNEDGGTPTDRLMATWGRTTDIEYIYSVEVNARGETLSEDMQAPKHEILPFRGKREGRHPLLWVSTQNNMVLDKGTTQVRYAPAPMLFPLDNVSREAVMDAQPWLYEVMTKELAREGKIVDNAGPGNDTISHPRRFAFIEGCGEVGDNALTFEVRVGDWWISSDRGIPEYRIVRDGCFRAAVPLPANVTAQQIRAVQVIAHERPEKPTTTPIRFRRLNAVFMLDEQLRPGRSIVKWEGNAQIKVGGPPLEIAIP